MIRFLMTVAALTMLATGVAAETVTIEFIGSVEYNQINQGVFAGVNSGDAVYASFNIDSDNWVAAECSRRDRPLVEFPLVRGLHRGHLQLPGHPGWAGNL